MYEIYSKHFTQYQATGVDGALGEDVARSVVEDIKREQGYATIPRAQGQISKREDATIMNVRRKAIPCAKVV